MAHDRPNKGSSGFLRQLPDPGLDGIAVILRFERHPKDCTHCIEKPEANPDNPEILLKGIIASCNDAIKMRIQ